MKKITVVKFVYRVVNEQFFCLGVGGRTLGPEVMDSNPIRGEILSEWSQFSKLLEILVKEAESIIQAGRTLIVRTCIINETEKI